MGLVQNWPFFFNSFFQAKQARKMSFTIFQNEKNAFLGYKNKTLKKSKDCYFSKGVNPSFLDKDGLFCMFFLLGKIGQENVFYYILKRKNAFLGSKIKKFQKSKNYYFCKGVNPWFWSKNGHFSNFFFFGKRDKEKSFSDIPERKNTFLGYKIKKFKKSKNCQFSKGVNQWFWSKKWPIFKLLFLGAIWVRKICFSIFQNEKRLSRL